MTVDPSASGTDFGREGLSATRILIVDDDAMQRAMVRQVLARNSYEVEEAANGREGLEKARSFNPDLVVLDIMMPELNGFEACAKLRSTPELSRIPVLMVTTLHDASSIERAFDAGASSFLTKPVHWHLFRLHIRYMLRTARQELAAYEARVRAERESLMGRHHAKDRDVSDARADYSDFVTEIRQSGSRLLSVIDQVLDIVKLDSGNLNLHETEVDMAGIVRDIAAYVGPLAATAGVSLNAAIESGLPRLWMDEGKVRSGMQNLLSSAIRLTPAGGSVLVRAEQSKDGSVHLSASNSGACAGNAGAATLFDVFFGVDNSLDRKFEAVGSGLPLSIAMTKMHDGTLAIDCTFGAGTIARVILPAERAIAWRGAA